MVLQRALSHLLAPDLPEARACRAHLDQLRPLHFADTVRNLQLHHAVLRLALRTRGNQHRHPDAKVVLGHNQRAFRHHAGLFLPVERLPHLR